MKRISMLAAGVITGGAMMFGPTMPAQAVWALPSSGPLTDAGGATNGCTAEIAPLSIGPIEGASRALKIDLSLTCPASADVHRDSFGLTLLKVLPDGSLQKMFSGTFAKSASTDPIVGTGTAGSYIGCNNNPDYEGTNTWVARALIKTKHSKTDTNPFIAKVHNVQTLTC